MNKRAYWLWGAMLGIFLIPLIVTGLSLFGSAPLGIKANNTTEALLLLTINGLIVITLASVFLTRHRVNPDSLKISFGIIFRATILMSDIEKARQFKDEQPFGFGLRFSTLKPGTTGAIFLLGYVQNMVEIILKGPRRFRLLGFIPLWVKTDRLVINLNEPKRFTELLRNQLKRPKK